MRPGKSSQVIGGFFYWSEQIRRTELAEKLRRLIQKIDSD